jgi:CubicO group peptidase (beta-lactamase class C family)
MTIHGTVSKGFERVREAFETNFRDGGEVGAAFCLHVKSRKVVDLWGGIADIDNNTRWKEDTAALVFSTTKGATAMCALTLVDQKRLDLDAPVARYWPEFAAAGKADVPVRMLLNHRVGLPVVDDRLTREEVLAVGPVVDALARQAPLWTPGSQHGYHALTYGWLVGELVRRVTGKSIGAYFRDEIAGPLGLDFWIGLPPELEPRVAKLRAEPPPDPAIAAQMEAMFGPESLAGRALTMSGALAGDGFAQVYNLPEVHRSEIPAANGVTTARSLSRLYAACIGTVKGKRLFGKRTLAKACTIESDAPDAVLFLRTTFGLGFMLNGPEFPLIGPTSFGHPGAGGSLGFADAASGVAFGYVMNQMGDGLLTDPRAARLIQSVKESLGL